MARDVGTAKAQTHAFFLRRIGSSRGRAHASDVRGRGCWFHRGV